jgi:hypothetical protein
MVSQQNMLGNVNIAFQIRRHAQFIQQHLIERGVRTLDVPRTEFVDHHPQHGHLGFKAQTRHEVIKHLGFGETVEGELLHEDPEFVQAHMFGHVARRLGLLCLVLIHQRREHGAQFAQIGRLLLGHAVADRSVNPLLLEMQQLGRDGLKLLDQCPVCAKQRFLGNGHLAYSALTGSRATRS